MTETEETIEILNSIGGLEEIRFYPDRDRWFIRSVPNGTRYSNWIVVSKFDDSDNFIYPYGTDPVGGFEILNKISADYDYIATKLADPRL